MIEKIKEDFFSSYKPNKVPIWVYLFFVHIISVIVIAFAIPSFFCEQKEQYLIGVSILGLLAIGWGHKFNEHIKSSDFKKEENKRHLGLKNVLIENNMTKSKDITFLYKLADKKIKKNNVFKFTGIAVFLFFLLNPIYNNFLSTFFSEKISNQLLFTTVLFISIVVLLLLYSSLLYIFNNTRQFKTLRNDLGSVRLEMKAKNLKQRMISRKNLLILVSEVVEKELVNYDFDLFIFGSQANKEELIAADIDLGIKATKPIEPIVLSSIKHLLNDELASLYTFDIVDFRKADANFAKIALQNIEYLHYDESQSQR